MAPEEKVIRLDEIPEPHNLRKKTVILYPPEDSEKVRKKLYDLSYSWSADHLFSEKKKMAIWLDRSARGGGCLSWSDVKYIYKPGSGAQLVLHITLQGNNRQYSSSIVPCSCGGPSNQVFIGIGASGYTVEVCQSCKKEKI